MAGDLQDAEPPMLKELSENNGQAEVCLNFYFFKETGQDLYLWLLLSYIT